MVYYKDGGLIIRTMESGDASRLSAAETAQGWHPTEGKHRMRLSDMAAGKCTALCAEVGGEPVGYISVYFEPVGGPFAGDGRCELVDFGVLEKCRRRGIGSKLMDTAEKIAGEYWDNHHKDAASRRGVWLGVGLHPGYGAAQRLYVKRGYIPDGSGAWYDDKIAEQYKTYPLDDSLIIYMEKDL